MDVEQWIRQLPSFSQQDFDRLERAVQLEREARASMQMQQACIIFARFRKKFLPPTLDSGDDDSPGEVQDSVQEGLERLTSILHVLRTRRVQCLLWSAFTCLKGRATHKRFRTRLWESDHTIDLADKTHAMKYILMHCSRKRYGAHRLSGSCSAPEVGLTVQTC